MLTAPGYRVWLGQSCSPDSLTEGLPHAVVAEQGEETRALSLGLSLS